MLHALNPIFRRGNSYYQRYIEYLSSCRTKSTFNVTIDVAKELVVFKNLNTECVTGVYRYETIMDYCRVSLLEEVLRYRESVRCNDVYGAGILLDTGLTAYLGGFRPPVQCLSGL